MSPSAVGTVMIAALVALVLVVVARSAVRIVPQAHAACLERLGRYVRTLGPGVHFVVPVVDKVRPPMDLREQRRNDGPQPVVTADDQVVDMAMTVHFRIVDPRAAAYEVADYGNAVGQLAVTALRNVMGEVPAGDIDRVRIDLGQRVRDAMAAGAGAWGIRVNHVELGSGGVAAGIAARLSRLAETLPDALTADLTVASEGDRDLARKHLADAARAIEEARRRLEGPAAG